MEGRKEINDAIIQEWKIGLGALPAIEFSYLISGKIEQTLLHQYNTNIHGLQ
jgi:hypothetical protein